MSRNSYSKSCTPNLGGVKDFYTREEIINLLKLKADKFSTYTKEQVDEFIESIITGTGFATAEQGALADTAVQPVDLVNEREVFTVSTEVLSDQSTGLVQVQAFSAYAIAEITLSHPSRVRVYSSNAARAADLSRPVSTPPEYGSGLIAEVVTSTTNYRQIFTPMVVGGNLEIPFSKNVYLSVTNLSGSSRAIDILVSLLGLEKNPVT